MVDFSKLNCKNCRYYDYDHGMMGFEPTEDCGLHRKTINIEKLGVYSFWCKDHSELKEKEPEKPKKGFYKKDKEPVTSWDAI